MGWKRDGVGGWGGRVMVGGEESGDRWMGETGGVGEEWVGRKEV
jgi:hypothetical protein